MSLAIILATGVLWKTASWLPLRKTALLHGLSWEAGVGAHDRNMSKGRHTSPARPSTFPNRHPHTLAQTHTRTLTDRQTDRQTDRHTHTPTSLGRCCQASCCLAETCLQLQIRLSACRASDLWQLSSYCHGYLGACVVHWKPEREVQNRRSIKNRGSGRVYFMVNRI